MRRPPSLMARIVWRLSLTTLAAIVCAYAWLWWEFKSTTASLRDRSLIESARTIARMVKIGGDGTISFTISPQMADAYALSGGVHGFAVKLWGEEKVLFSGGADVGPAPHIRKNDEDGELYQFDPDGPGPNSYFGEALPLNVGGHQMVVQVVRLSSDYQDLIETVLGDFFEDGGWLAAPFLLALLLVSILTVRGTLAPLRELSQRVGEIGPKAPDLRLPLAGIPREILPLVKAVNSAFDRLDEGYRQQREFTADAAHELRTPLAVLRAHADTMEDKEAAKALRADIETMSHLVEQLLRVASAEAMVLEAGDRADLCAIARDVAAYLGPVAIRSGRTLEVEAPEHEVLVRGQEEALFHAVRNLADNALRHTPPGTAVTVSVSDAPPQLSVRDWGPGVPPEKREAVFRRFWRADRRANGTGLGLSIVQRTAEAHGGTVGYEDAGGGGAVFRLVFPAP